MNGPKHRLPKLFWVICECFVIVFSQECASPQHLEFGKSGSVICSFVEGFYGVYWYNSTDYQEDFPVVFLSRSAKGGTGYTTGEFDIFPNGSLLIHNVSLAHDHVFTVTLLPSQKESLVRIDVLVVVTVIPTIPAPTILSCEEDISVQNCLLEIYESTTLLCSVKKSRPAVDLKWTRRTGGGDDELLFTSRRFPEDICYTSHVTTNIRYSNSFYLDLYSCQGKSPAGLLERTESFILIKNGNLNLEGVHQISKVFPRFSELMLVCTKTHVQAFVWERVIPSRNISETLLYATQIKNTIATKLNDEFSLRGTNSLVLPRIDIKDEGMYSCISTDGTVENVALYNVSVVVQPVPSYPFIDGCSHGHNCAIEVLSDGVLTCRVKRIRPEIQLEWSTVRESDKGVIALENHRSHVQEKDSLFYVSLTVTYKWKRLSQDKITMKCYGVGSNARFFQLMATVDLLLNGSTVVPGRDKEATFQHLWWIVPAAIVITSASVIVTVILLRKRKGGQKASKQKGDAGETVPMMVKQQDLTRKRFIHQLQQRYEDLYNGVPLVPYRADELYHVDKVYKKSTIDHLVSKKGGQENWVEVSSYKELFVNNSSKSTRRILHGEPGYGKSIICLKIAYDWCNSELENVEILLLVHLKQLGGVNSIYTAIKSYILPKDTALDENDIAKILEDSKSVLVILDGFDEYPDQDTDIVTDVNSIISRRMFQQSTVVITTRSSFTPSKYPPQTEIYRLRGFDDNCRKKYIRGMTNDNKESKTVQAYLEAHPVLLDLSQVPFLLACFVSMIQEGVNIKAADSVTEVFRQITSCFHAHMRNKRMLEDINTYDLFGKDHKGLDEITYDSLKEYKWRIVWPKDKLIEKVGLDLYKQYTQIGILVEDEGVDIKNYGSEEKDILQKKEVSFVHKLFCEWYAAHHLSLLTTKPDADLNNLLAHLDPSTLQYVYRFACGLNIECAKKLIGYLPKLKGGEKCATLCIQEQLGAIDDFKDTISLICKHGIIISKHDSMFLQKSLVKVLKTAAEQKIPIKSLCVYNSLKSVNASAITTSSEEKIYSEFPIERLKINITDRSLEENEALQFLKFSVQCSTLNYIKFGNCVPPEDIGRLDRELLGDLQKRRIAVKWRLDFDAEFYSLNLKTGRWEADPRKGQEGQPKPLTSEEYKELLEKHEKAMEKETEEKCKNDVERGREILRTSHLKK